MLDNLWGTIKANFFYDLRSTIVSICVLIGAFFLYKLMKYDGEKVYKSMRYLTLVAIFFSTAYILQ